MITKTKSTLKQMTTYQLKSENIKIILTSGASCPDSEVDKVLKKLLSFYENIRPIKEVIQEFNP